MTRPLSDLPLGRLGDALAAAGPGPAAGSTSAVTAGLAAGLAAKVARAEERGGGRTGPAEELDELRRRALALADDDVAAYEAHLAARRRPGGGPGAVEQIVQVPADVVTLAVRVAELAAALAEEGPPALSGDATAAALLAASAAEAAAALVGINIADGAGSGAAEPGDPRVEDAADRAGHARGLAERLV